MSHTLVTLGLRISLLSGLHVGTGFGKGKLLDDLMVQGPHPEVDATLPYIPGSTLKGRLVERARLLGDALGLAQDEYAGVHARLFGNPDRAGSLTFSNAYVERAMAQDIAGIPRSMAAARHDRSFVSLSRGRRVALDGRLFRIDVADAGLEFRARIHGALPDASAARDLTMLAAAITLVTHIGGHKGRGLGHCRIDIESAEPAILDWDAWLGVA